MFILFRDRNTCRQAQIYNHFCLPGCMPQSVVPEVPDSIHGSATYFRCPSADSRRVSCWRNYVHLVLVNRLEGRDLSLPRNSVGSLPCTFSPPDPPPPSRPIVLHKTLKYIINTVIRERRRCRVVKDAFSWCRKSPESRELAPRLRHQLHRRRKRGGGGAGVGQAPPII